MKIDDEDKALRLIWSLPPSYEHMQTVLMYGKENVNFSEVTSKLISEERRLKMERTSLLKVQHCRFVEMGRKTKAPKRKLSAGDVGNLDI